MSKVERRTGPSFVVPASQSEGRVSLSVYFGMSLDIASGLDIVTDEPGQSAPQLLWLSPAKRRQWVTETTQPLPARKVIRRKAKNDTTVMFWISRIRTQVGTLCTASSPAGARPQT